MAFPDVAIEIAFPNWLFDTSLTWTDISQYVESVRTHVGRRRELERYAAGGATIIADTRGGRFDPIDPDSPYAGDLLPRKPIRCVATWDGVDYPVFYHLVDDFLVDYPGAPTVTIPTSDWFAYFAKKGLPLSPYAMMVKAAGPKAWWRFGEEENPATTTVAGDSSSGGGNAGVFHGHAEFRAVVAPWGDDRGVQLTDGAWVAFPASAAVTGDFTIEGTFITTVTDFDELGPDVDVMHLFSQGEHRVWNSGGYYTSTRGIQILLNRDGGTINAHYGGAVLESIDAYNDGDPHLLRLEWDGTTLTLRIDDETVSTTTVPDTSAKPAAPVLIGKLSSTSSDAYNWRGGLQDWQMYDESLGATDFNDRYAAWINGWRGDSSGERLNRLLTLIGVPNTGTFRDLDDGNSTLTGTKLGTKGLEEMHRVNDTEDGVFVVMPDGKVTFLERHARLFSPYTVSQATFYDDDPSNPAGCLMYEDVVPGRPLDAIRNHVEITPDGGNTQIGDDLASQDIYGEAPYQLNTLHDSDNAARDAVNWILIRYGNPAARFKKIVLTPYGQEDDMFPQMLGRRVGDRITAVRNLLSGEVFEQDLHIEGIEHDFGDNRWVTTWDVSPADTNTWWILGDATYGVLGSTTRLAA